MHPCERGSFVVCAVGRPMDRELVARIAEDEMAQRTRQLESVRRVREEHLDAPGGSLKSSSGRRSLGRREGEIKDTPMAPLAGGTYLTAELFDDALDDREAEAMTLRLPRGDAGELAEQSRDLCIVESGSVVAHPET